jgi:tungstate transport system substrate-binding protein
MRRAAAALALLLAACARESPSPSFALAAATTLEGSGVLPMLVTEFKRDTGIEIHPIVLSSRQALNLAAQHQASVTITNYPAAERAFVARNGATTYRQLMWNDFVIVGPASDPADVAHARSAAGAFRRIALAHAIFFSRNDQSGTNAKELALWRAALIVPTFSPAYITMDQPMAGLLRSSSNMKAYTLSDRATFERLENELQLRLLHAGDPFLRNVYSVILVRPADANAKRFVDWLLQGRGHSLIENYLIKGKRAFHMM